VNLRRKLGLQLKKRLSFLTNENVQEGTGRVNRQWDIRAGKRLLRVENRTCFGCVGFRSCGDATPLTKGKRLLARVGGALAPIFARAKTEEDGGTPRCGQIQERKKKEILRDSCGGKGNGPAANPPLLLARGAFGRLWGELTKKQRTASRG